MVKNKKVKQGKINIPVEFLRRGRSRPGRQENELEVEAELPPPELPPAASPPVEEEEEMMPTLVREMEPVLEAPRMDEPDSEDEEPAVLPLLKKVSPRQATPSAAEKLPAKRRGRPSKPKVKVEKRATKKATKRKQDGTIIDKEVPSTSSSVGKAQTAGTRLRLPGTAKAGTRIAKAKSERKAKPEREERPPRQRRAKKMRTQDGTVNDNQVPSTSRSVQLQGAGVAPPPPATVEVKERHKVAMLERPFNPLRRIVKWRSTEPNVNLVLEAPDLDVEDLRSRIWFRLRRMTGKIFYINLVLGPEGDTTPKSLLFNVCIYVKQKTGEMAHLVVAKVDVTPNPDSTLSLKFRIVEPKFAKGSCVTKEVLDKVSHEVFGTVWVPVGPKQYAVQPK